MSIDDRIVQAAARLGEGIDRHRPAAFASSLGAEDMVILDLIHRLALDVEIFTLDTGRLHQETHDLLARARARYGRPIRVLVPDGAQLEAYASTHGSNAFYESVELRERCCEIRKLAPLRRALHGKALWITGLRRGQSAARTDVDVLGHDAANGLMKLNPLADWSDADVQGYIVRHEVPVNALHARGYPSIGCAPCTRAVQPGENARAGRWWWEQAGARECGLHVDANGRLVRTQRGAPATQ
ncbi:MAG: phosphoadenylyl-sulfate reductase [Burkholderiales bacterium]|nr:phosphoadenylyl-sulfate reductase [Burkholderiales bacterium]